MRVKLCGKYWTLRRTTLHLNAGECDAPAIRNKEIRVDKRLQGHDELETLIHEMMHATDWRADEEHITEAAKDIAAVLWRLGYRRSE